MALAKNDQKRFENTEIIKYPNSSLLIVGKQGNSPLKTGKLKVLLLWPVQRVSVM